MRIPHFSNYDGGDKFIYQEKQYHRVQSLGSGSFGDVTLFEERDQKQRCIVKSERALSL